MIDFSNGYCVFAAITRVHLCVIGEIPYDDYIKQTAIELVQNGDKHIFVQCLANGNLEMAEDVVAEAKTHYDIWTKTQVTP